MTSSNRRFSFTGAAYRDSRKKYAKPKNQSKNDTIGVK